MTALRDHLSTFEDRCAHGFHTVQHPSLCRCTETDEWTLFLAAVRAAVRDGRVHQRDVRPLVRGRIEPKHIGLSYRRAVREGLLAPLAPERSDDEAGKNAGRWEPVYEWRGAA